MPESNQLETSRALGDLSSSIFCGAKVYVRVNPGVLPIAPAIVCVKSATCSSRTRLTVHPPNPPPVMRPRSFFWCGPNILMDSRLQYLDRARPRPARILGITAE